LFYYSASFFRRISSKNGTYLGSKKTEKAKAKTLACICNCLIVKSIFFLIPDMAHLSFNVLLSMFYVCAQKLWIAAGIV